MIDSPRSGFKALTRGYETVVFVDSDAFLRSDPELGLPVDQLVRTFAPKTGWRSAWFPPNDPW